jgi:hypothetical protein
LREREPDKVATDLGLKAEVRRSDARRVNFSWDNDLDVDPAGEVELAPRHHAIRVVQLEEHARVEDRARAAVDAHFVVRALRIIRRHWRNGDFRREQRPGQTGQQEQGQSEW